MPTQSRYDVNPFESPVKAMATSTPTKGSRAQHPDVLATADLLFEQLKKLENLYSTVEERVQRKRRALKELEYLILGDTADESPCGPACPTNTPIGSRLHLVSPRLRGLFDLRGPGQANVYATQSCLDYSPEVEVDVFTHEEPGRADEWEDDDEEPLLCPFDDKYALWESPRKEQKALPAVPRERASEAIESKIPRKVYVRRQASASRRPTGRSPSVLTSPLHRRRSLRGVKPTNTGSDIISTKGTMRRASWKRSLLENVKSKGGTKASPAIENECAKDGARRKEKRKGLWSIYSVRSELGLSGTYHAI